MNIYPSTKVRPYVYIGIDPMTGQFYIGYREANLIPSHLDLFEYKTSSEIIKPIFDRMNWSILAEFFNGDYAFDFEQRLIFENWGDPLLLNKNVRLPNGKKRFKAKKGLTRSKTHCDNLSKSLKGRPGRKQSNEEKELRSINQKAAGGYGPEKHSDKTKQKMAESHIGKTAPWNSKPHTEEWKKANSLRQTGKIRGPNKRKMEKIICPYCLRNIPSNNYSQHHGNNCKLKPKT